MLGEAVGGELCQAAGWKLLHWEAVLDTQSFYKAALYHYDSAPFFRLLHFRQLSKMISVVLRHYRSSA
jgi:hypothetical protein